MGKTYPAIEGAIKEFIEAQQMFFVGSAPLDAKGHVNVSPKGLDTFVPAVARGEWNPG